jgi:hypothetical protein
VDVALSASDAGDAAVRVMNLDRPDERILIAPSQTFGYPDVLRGRGGALALTGSTRSSGSRRATRGSGWRT